MPIFLPLRSATPCTFGTRDQYLAVAGGPAEDGDGEISVALGDERELGSRAEADIDRVGAQSLLQLRAAVEIDLGDVDAMQL